MSPWVRSLIVVAIVSALPLLGIALFARHPERLARRLSGLVPLAAGALLGAPLFHLIPEALGKGGGAAAIMGWIAVGGAVFFVLDRALHGRVGQAMVANRFAASAIGAPGGSATERLRELVPLFIVGDALHNALDGVLIATAFLDEPTLGIVTGLAIAMHELPRELGTFSLLLAAGVTLRQAVTVNVITAALAASSAVVTLWLGQVTPSSSGTLLAVGAGTFLYLGGALVVGEWRGGLDRRSAMVKGALLALGLLLTATGRHTH